MATHYQREMPIMRQVRVLVQAGEVDKARKILKPLTHPKAKLWLKQLNEKYPPKSSERYLRLVLAALVSLAIVLALLMAIDHARVNATIEAVQSGEISNVLTYSEAFDLCRGEQGQEFFDCLHETYEGQFTEEAG